MRYGGKDVRESKEGCGKVGGEVCEEELPKARMQNRTAEKQRKLKKVAQERDKDLVKEYKGDERQ